MSTDTNVIEKTDVKTDLKLPSMYKVIYLNDDVTTMQFVLETLIKYFDYNDETAYDKVMEIHESDEAVVGIFSYEIAEQKGVEVTLEARNQGFPLQVKVEEE